MTKPEADPGFPQEDWGQIVLWTSATGSWSCFLIMQAVADPEFPRGGASIPGSANLLFDQFFLKKTAWKWRNFGPEGGARPLDPPLADLFHLDKFSLLQRT